MEQPESFRILDGILGAEDFEEGVYRSVAAICFAQYRESGRVEPAKLISRFETREEQSLAADICSTSLRDDMKPEEQKRAFADTVIRIRTHSIEEANAKAVQENDAAKLLQLMKAKRELQNLHKRLLQN